MMALLAMLLLLAAGMGLAMLALHARPQALRPYYEGPLLLGLSVVFGAAAVSAAWFLLSFALAGAPLRWAVAAFCLVAFGAGLCRWRAVGSPRIAWPCGPLITTLWIAQIAIVLWQALAIPMGGDAILIWDFKARLAFFHGGRIPAEYFGTRWAWNHGTYPLFIPLLETWIYSWLGVAHEGLAKLAFPPFFAAALCLLWTGVRSTTGSARAAGWASLLLFFVPWIMFKPGGAATAYADFPLAAAYLAALVFAFRSIDDGSSLSLSPLAACLTLMPWIKQEGVILAGTVILIVALLRRGPWHARLRTAALLAAGPILVSLAWRSYVASVHAAHDDSYLRPSIAVLAAHSSRLIPIVCAFLLQAVKWAYWSLLWPGAFVALILLARRRPRHAAALALAILIPAGIYVCVFTLSAWPNYIDHIKTALTRLLVPLAMPALLAIGFALASPCSAKENCRGGDSNP